MELDIMCRPRQYKKHLACFHCRKMFRRWGGGILCPQCRQEMRDMGRDFKAPKMRDSEQWNKVQLLANYNILYHSCNCALPGYRPRRLREVPAFLVKSLPKSEGQLLLERLSQLKSGTPIGKR